MPKKTNPEKEKIRKAKLALESICKTAIDDSIDRPTKLGRIKQLASYALLQLGDSTWNERFNQQMRLDLLEIEQQNKKDHLT